MIVPAQRDVPRQQKISKNHHQRWMPKHPERISRFDSRAELLFAALMEADTRVRRYVPQPFDIPIKQRQKWYRPDFYLARADGSEHVIEVTTPMRAEKRPIREVTAYLKSYGMQYDLVLTTWIYERLRLAESWLAISQIIHMYRDVDNAPARQAVTRGLKSHGALTTHELIQLESSIPGSMLLAAVCQMLHSGAVQAALEESPFTLYTEITP